MSWHGTWRPYVPVAKRRAKAAAYAARLAKKEKRTLSPVSIAGRKIASSFWGQAWCDNLEQYSDFANRLPRGRTYVRNGSVIDLQLSRGKIKSIVSGSEIYRIEIEIAVLKKALWNRLKRDCSSAIDSLLDLLQGRFDQGVMQRLTQRNDGLFPQPREIKMRCSCPDWAGLCKHLAATLYGVGARLDAAPELLFTLRGVDHPELIGEAVGAANLDRALEGRAGAQLVGADLREVFGIDIELGTNGDSATSESREVAGRKEVELKTRSRRSTATSPQARRKKQAAAERNSVARDAQPKTGSRKKSAPKTTKTVEALATAKATIRTNSNRKTAAKATSTSARKPSRGSTSARKRPKAR
jgi:uncharacterized Zn finger protein